MSERLVEGPGRRERIGTLLTIVLLVALVLAVSYLLIGQARDAEQQSAQTQQQVDELTACVNKANSSSGDPESRLKAINDCAQKTQKKAEAPVSAPQQGLPGRDGIDGIDGRDGSPGPRGPVGPAGRDGSDGTDGTDGTDGGPGADGRDGAAGDDGANGADGAPGETGASGADGAKGDTGLPGSPGPKGDTGATGPKGDTGSTGPKGDTGPAGTDGRDGRGIASISCSAGSLIVTYTDSTEQEIESDVCTSQAEPSPAP